MAGMRLRRRGVARVVLLIVLAVALVVWRAPVARAVVAALVDVATGSRVAFDRLDVGADRIRVAGVRVERGGDPLFSADVVEIDYRARGFFSDAVHKYGLRRIVLVRPVLTIVRHADGGLNLGAVPGGAAPAAQRGTPSAQHGAGTPWRFEADVRDGRVAFEDAHRVLPESRAFTLEGVQATLHYDAAGSTTYRLRARLAGTPARPVELAGRIDAAGFALHHLRAAELALAPIADYFINTPSARFERGRIGGLDVRAYAFAGGYHVAGTASLTDGAMALPGLLVDATDMHGRIDLADGGILTPDLRARLGPLDVRLAGGVFDWNAPALRLGIVAAPSTLGRVRELFAFSRRLPLEGGARLSALVEGPAGAPLVATGFDAPDLAYAQFPVRTVSGRAIYYDGAVDIVDSRGSYGPAAVSVIGSIELSDPVRTTLLVDARAAADELPYAAQVAPGAQIHAAAVLAGDGLQFDARGLAEGTGGGTEVSGVFHLDPRGDGAFGPFVARRGAASLAGAYYSQRSTSESGFWLDSVDYPFALASADPHLPGLDLAPPPFSGRFDGSVAGDGPPSRFRIAGRIAGRDLRVGTVALDAVSADVTGGFADLRLGAVAARGPWGTFTGRGGYAERRLALEGEYSGSFAALRPYTGELGAAGPIAGPVALLVDPQRTVVQARGDRTDGTMVHGVPVDGLAGTLGVENAQVRVYGATVDVAGATLAAAGDLNSPAGIGVSLAGADGSRLRGLTSLGAGRVSAIGRLGVATPAGAGTRFDGGLALDAATVGGLAVAGNGDVELTGSRLRLGRTDATVGAALATLSGGLEGFGSAATRYDVDVRLAETPIGPLARVLYPRRRDVMGTVQGDVRVTGTAANLRVAGRVAVPEGTVNGLAFSDASAAVDVDPRNVRLDDGRVTVGSTQARFGLRYGSGRTALRVEAPHADLADFNDYFDAGDTLGGRGRLSAHFVQDRGVLETGADISIASLRYRRFDLGDATAAWTSHGADVTGAVAFGGASGRLDAGGTVTLPQRVPVRRLFGAARFRGAARLRGLDLGVWLPAFGYQIPILGRVDAQATVTGPLGNPLVRTDATLAGGSIGRFPVDSLALSAATTMKGTTLTRGALALPGLAVEASGTFGLGPRDPLRLALHAKSPDVGVFADRLFGANYPVSGTAEADMRVEGSRLAPRVTGGVDVENMLVRGVAVPQALGQFSVAGRDIVLSGVEVSFATGALYLAGSVPIEVAPFSFGPARAPITLDLTAKGIDLAGFTTLLPAGSALAGKLDGRVAIAGTAGAPELDGALTLGGGSLRTPLEMEPLAGLSARLSFDGTAATLDALHATAAGGGSLDATGTANIPNLIHPSVDAAYRLEARATALHLDVPVFGSGTVDGTLAVTHQPAALPVLGGKLALSDATIPFSALLLAAGGAGGGFDASTASAGAVKPGSDVALALTVSADRNVRVRSANVDIGARGDLAIGGTRSAPQLSGVFTSTGGTLTYFNTVFRVVDGTVSFEPDLGVIPTLDARATTHVINPDPNTVRNVSGSADITLGVTGPVTNLAIALSSDPAYERQQILGLLLNAPALGAKNLFGDTPGTPTLLGSNTTSSLAPAVAANRNVSGELSVAQEAFGIANAQFTRTLLAPFESTVASAVGLSNLNVNVDYTGSVGLTARKILGKNVDAIYGTTFGYPYRQTFGFDVKGGAATAGQVTVFQTLGATGLNSLTPNTYLYTTNPKLQATQPTAGTAGFSLSLQRLFW